MKCPFCSYRDSRVVDSRAVDDGVSIRRRRECPDCGRRFTTYEKYEETPLMVTDTIWPTDHYSTVFGTYIQIAK